MPRAARCRQADAEEEQSQAAHALHVSLWSLDVAGRPRAEGAETSQDREGRARSLEQKAWSDSERPKEKAEFGEEEAPSEGFAGCCFGALAVGALSQS